MTQAKTVSTTHVSSTYQAPDGSLVTVQRDMEVWRQAHRDHNGYRAKKSWYWWCSCGAESVHFRLMDAESGGYRHAKTKKHQ